MSDPPRGGPPDNGAEDRADNGAEDRVDELAEDRAEDRTKNREGLLLPVLLPVGILLIIALVLFGFSRILLHLSSTGATVVALSTAAVAFIAVSVVASRERVTGAALFPMLGAIVGAAMLIGGVGLVAAPKEESGGNLEAVSVSLTAPPGAATKGYSTNALSFKTETPTNLEFDNQDPSVPHNVVIFEGKDDKGTQVFTGEIITGPNKATYAVPALKAGDYYFHCEVHPTTMQGTITVSDTGGGGGLTISASSLQYSTDKLEAPAGVPATVTFDNMDAGVPHNFAVFTDKAYANSVFSGEIITGPATIDYTLPALDAGTYYFKCEVHPTMQGVLVVGGAGGGGSGGAGASGPAPPPPTQSGSSAPPPTSPPPSGGGASGGATIALSASGLEFSTDQIQGAADVANTIHFDNQDTGVPHDVAIYRDAGFTDNVFTGDLVTGPASIDYSVPALPAGTYYFDCTVHTTMQGTYVVGGH